MLSKTAKLRCHFFQRIAVNAIVNAYCATGKTGFHLHFDNLYLRCCIIFRIHHVVYKKNDAAKVISLLLKNKYI